jgi:DNA-directed RNA polymerase subunit K/omega
MESDDEGEIPGEIVEEPVPDEVEEGEPEEDEEDEGDEEVPGSEAEEAAHDTKFSRALNPKVDPLLKASNAHRRVIIVPKDERITSNVLQKTEEAHVFAVRAKQIEMFPTDSGDQSDSVERAKKELSERKTPLLLRRVVGFGPAGELICEEWNIRTEMVYAPLD